MELLGQPKIKQMKSIINWIVKYTRESLKIFRKISRNYQGFVNISTGFLPIGAKENDGIYLGNLVKKNEKSQYILDDFPIFNLYF